MWKYCLRSQPNNAVKKTASTVILWRLWKIKIRSHKPKVKIFIVMFYSYQLISLVLHDQPGNKTAKPSQHDTQRMLFSPSCWHLRGRSRIDPTSSRIERPGLLIEVEGCENISAAALTFLPFKQIDFVYSLQNGFSSIPGGNVLTQSCKKICIIVMLWGQFWNYVFATHHMYVILHCVRAWTVTAPCGAIVKGPFLLVKCCVLSTCWCVVTALSFTLGSVCPCLQK